MKKTLKQELHDHLKREYPKWVHSGELEKLTIDAFGYKGSTGGRTLRLLASEGILEAEERKNMNGTHSVWYRAKLPSENVDKFFESVGRVQYAKVFVDGEWKMKKMIV